MEEIFDLNISVAVPVIAPGILRQDLPVTDAARRTVIAGREAVKRILRREDDRLLVVVGPCSIHDTGAALEYASRLNELRQAVEDHLCIIM